MVAAAFQHVHQQLVCNTQKIAATLNEYLRLSLQAGHRTCALHKSFVRTELTSRQLLQNTLNFVRQGVQFLTCTPADCTYTAILQGQKAYLTTTVYAEKKLHYEFVSAQH